MSDYSDISRKPTHDPPTRWLCTTKDCTGLALYGDKELQPGEVRTGPATKCYTHRPGQHPYELAVVHEAPPRPTGDDRRAIRRWLVISDMAAQHARNMHQALQHVIDELEILDGYPTQCIGAADPTSEPRTESCRVCNGRGCDQCAAMKYTATERAAHLRYNLHTQREQMRDDLATIEQLMSSAGEVINRTLRGRIARPAATHRLCEPTGHEGCMVPLEEGGWADYTCTMLADKAGLCGKHYAAKRRYLVRNGLPTRMDEAA